MIALSIEQMKHLEELGLDTSDASMYWDDVISTFNKITEKNRRYHEYYFKKAMLKNTPNKSKNIS